MKGKGKNEEVHVFDKSVFGVATAVVVVVQRQRHVDNVSKITQAKLVCDNALKKVCFLSESCDTFCRRQLKKVFEKGAFIDWISSPSRCSKGRKYNLNGFRIYKK